MPTGQTVMPYEENWVDRTSHPSKRDPPFQLLDRMPVDRSSESADSVYQYIYITGCIAMPFVICGSIVNWQNHAHEIVKSAIPLSFVNSWKKTLAGIPWADEILAIFLIFSEFGHFFCLKSTISRVEARTIKKRSKNSRITKLSTTSLEQPLNNLDTKNTIFLVCTNFVRPN